MNTPDYGYPTFHPPVSPPTEQISHVKDVERARAIDDDKLLTVEGIHDILGVNLRDDLVGREVLQGIQQLVEKLDTEEMKVWIQNIKNTKSKTALGIVKTIFKLIRSDIYPARQISTKSQKSQKQQEEIPEDRLPKGQSMKWFDYVFFCKCIRDILNVSCSPIYSMRGMRSLILIEGAIYLADIEEGAFIPLSPEDLEKTSSGIELLKNYAKGEAITPMTMLLVPPAPDDIDIDKMQDIYKMQGGSPNLFLGDRKLLTKADFLDYLANSYSIKCNEGDNGQFDSETKEEWRHKSEKYYLLALDFGYENAMRGLGNLYSAWAKEEVKEEERYELRKKAERYYFSAIRNGDVKSVELLRNLYINMYRWKSKKESNEEINKEIGTLRFLAIYLAHKRHEFQSKTMDDAEIKLMLDFIASRRPVIREYLSQE